MCIVSDEVQVRNGFTFADRYNLDYGLSNTLMTQKIKLLFIVHTWIMSETVNWEEGYKLGRIIGQTLCGICFSR